MPLMNTKLQTAALGIAEAAALLTSGELVAFPTETVYGLGADARRPAAVQKIYAAKGRPATNPLIVHVAHAAAAQHWAGGAREGGGWSELAQRLADRFWPGPLTLVVPRGSARVAGTICPEVSAGLTTVALRCPDHPVALALLKAFDGPIAAPSANRSGFVSPTSAAHVYAELAGRIPFILDGGSCAIGVESTVLDISRARSGNGGGGRPIILRHGGITREMIETVIGPVEVFQGHLPAHQSAASPGMLERHYAPRTRAYRFRRAQWPALQAQFATSSAPDILLTYDATIALPAPHETILLPDDTSTYARELYAALRQADEHAQAPGFHPELRVVEAGPSGGSSILVLLPDKEGGLWVAVQDRLRRATTEYPT